MELFIIGVAPHPNTHDPISSTHTTTTSRLSPLSRTQLPVRHLNLTHTQTHRRAHTHTHRHVTDTYMRAPRGWLFDIQTIFPKELYEEGEAATLPAVGCKFKFLLGRTDCVCKQQGWLVWSHQALSTQTNPYSLRQYSTEQVFHIRPNIPLALSPSFLTLASYQADFYCGFTERLLIKPSVKNNGFFFFLSHHPLRSPPPVSFPHLLTSIFCHDSGWI